MSISIDVGSFDLGNSATPRLSDGRACHAGITGVTVNKIDYSVSGNRTTYPPPGDDRPDPVRWLIREGWKPTQMVGTGEGPGGAEDNEAGQPASFGLTGQFDSMQIDYESPVACTCKDGKNERKFKWTVDYDRSKNAAPTTKLVETNPDPANPPEKQEMQVRPYKKETKIGSSPTTYSVTEESVVFIPCKCDPLSPCEARFTLHYTYTTSVVPD